MNHGPMRAGLGLLSLMTLGAIGCATLQQVAALRNVEFTLDRASDVRLAGVELARIRSFDDLSLVDAGRLALAVSRNQLPMDFQLHVLAENPADNPSDARLMRMDWTLLLQGKETLSGVFDRQVLLPPGQPTDVPIVISLNLLDFFQGGAQDMLELALALSGQGGAPKDVELRATPSIDTPLGLMRFPRPITIVSRTVGSP